MNIKPPPLDEDGDMTDYLADAVAELMTRLGLPTEPRYGTPAWDALAEEGWRRERERRRAYLIANPDAPRLPDEESPR